MKRAFATTLLIVAAFAAATAVAQVPRAVLTELGSATW